MLLGWFLGEVLKSVFFLGRFFFSSGDMWQIQGHTVYQSTGIASLVLLWISLMCVFPSGDTRVCRVKIPKCLGGYKWTSERSGYANCILQYMLRCPRVLVAHPRVNISLKTLTPPEERSTGTRYVRTRGTTQLPARDNGHSTSSISSGR